MYIIHMNTNNILYYTYYNENYVSIENQVYSMHDVMFVLFLLLFTFSQVSTWPFSNTY